MDPKKTETQSLMGGMMRRVTSMKDMAAPVLSRIPRSTSWTSLEEAGEPGGRVRRRSIVAKAAFDPKLHCFVGEGNLDKVTELLSVKGAVNIDQQDYEKRTPLHVAAAYKNVAMVTLLVKKGADVNSADVHNRTPLFDAGDSQEITEFLKKNGAVDSLKFFAKKTQEANTMESTDVINNNFLRKVILSFVAPLVVLLVLTGLSFALKFLSVTLAYYFFIVSFFVSEISIRPPWYRPNASKLATQGLARNRARPKV